MIPTREEIDVSNGTLCAMRDEIPAALKPSEDREAAIRAWEEDATLHRCGSRFDDDDPRATYLMARSEITAAVALMRSAGDGKALLRELREDLEVYPDGIWTTREMVAKIGLLLVQPAPVEQPAAAVPDHFPDAGKMVPDDTRELVAQLADVAAEFFVAPWCDRAKAIAAKLRGGA